MAGVGVGGYLTNLVGAFAGRVPRVAPYTEQGVSGTAIFGGYVETIETDHRLVGVYRYRTASEILANVSIVGAGLRFFLNLAASASWSWEPAKDMDDGQASSDEAKRAADWMQSCMDDMATAWPRIVRRSGSYRFHGFGIQEWTAKRREVDGRIGLLDVEPRPQHTIEVWDRDESGAVRAVGQRDPQTGRLIPLPRGKLMYLVDDTLTDSPEGLGLFRHLVEPANRLKRYHWLEATGFERDLRGIPVGRAPLAEINAAVKNGTLLAADRTRILEGMKKFLRMEARDKDTSLLLDSSAYIGTTADGTTVSGAMKWALELLSSNATSAEEIGDAINRTIRDMAIILGVETLLMGGDSTGGNRSLGEDKSRNLYLTVNAMLADVAEAANRDLRDAVWSLNGFPDHLKPKAVPADVAYKDVAIIAGVLRDMATAGAVLAPDDPAIDDIRDMAGISRRPQEAVDREMELAEIAQEQAHLARDSADIGVRTAERDLAEPQPTAGEGAA